MNIDEFKEKIRTGECPFCNRKFTQYDGCLGYFAFRCNNCGLSIDHNGINIEVKEE